MGAVFFFFLSRLERVRLGEQSAVLPPRVLRATLRERLLASGREKGNWECHPARVWAVTRQNPKVTGIVDATQMSINKLTNKQKAAHPYSGIPFGSKKV